MFALNEYFFSFYSPYQMNQKMSIIMYFSQSECFLNYFLILTFEEKDFISF